MVKFIKFSLKKDIKNNQLIFKLLEYNSNNPFHSKIILIDFNRKKISNVTSWDQLYIDKQGIADNRFTIYFNSGQTHRDINGENQMFRLSYDNYSLNKEYYFKLEKGENIDFYYNRLLESFNILTQRVK